MGRNFPSFHICLTVLTVKLELSLFVEAGESGLVSGRKKPPDSADSRFSCSLCVCHR